ncbi:MAG: FAD-binding protein, partial [Myxococcota bacterium]|nr:FAD-binding protein [Myxococcota bacterium]
DTITVEAGTNLWDLDALLKRYGYELPVKNGGWSGPTVGGFIAAGGISPTQQKDDGFWNYVREITCLSIDAEKMVLTRQDPLFAYLFGASGQLGLIASIKLDITPLNASLVSYPLDVSGQVPQFYSRATPFKDSQFLTWFCCFGAVEKASEMRSALEIFFKGHQMLFNKTEVQIYHFKHRDLHVPLLYDSRDDFAGVEIRGLQPLTESQSPKLLELVESYTKMVEDAGYQHYSQVELTAMPTCSVSSLSPQTQETFFRLKKTLDPQNRMNAPAFK